MPFRITSPAWKLLRSERGSVAIQIGLVLSGLIGMSALGTEITFLTDKHRQLQSAADSAAHSAAVAVAKGYPSDFALQARAVAAGAGFVNGANGVAIAVNQPPLAGAYTTDLTAVEVTITQPQTLALVSVFRSPLFSVKVRAVAIQGDQGSFCILGLDSSASGAVRIMQNGIVASPTCGVASNSSSSSGILLENNVAIFGPVSVVGNYSLANGAHLWDQTPPFPKSNGPAVTDPYSAVPLDPAGATARTQPTGCNPCTLNPGRYTAGWNFGNGVTLNLNAGVYYIDTRLNLGNNVVVNATAGVTLVIDGNYTFSAGNNVIYNLVAPTSGPTAGIAFASIRTATSTVTQKFSNDAIVNLQGAIYIPNQIVQFDNNTIINTPVCGEIVARIVQMQNNANLKNNCGGTGAVPISAGSAPKLVE
jgi:Flp pilus assembly protein TadG